MKKLIVLVGMGFAFIVSSPAYSGAQQEKMKGCSVEAKNAGLKGSEYKAFISKCLKKDYVLKANGAAAAASTAPAKPTTTALKDRKKACTGDAKGKGLKGEELKTFVGSCLNG